MVSNEQPVRIALFCIIKNEAFIDVAKNENYSFVKIGIKPELITDTLNIILANPHEAKYYIETEIKDLQIYLSSLPKLAE